MRVFSRLFSVFKNVPAAPAAFLVVLGLIFASTASGQATAGAIRGVVTDPTGAVIIGVEVGTVNLETGTEYSTRTTEAGVYFLGNLPVGNYRVEAEMEGFRRFVQEPVNVATATTTPVRITLELGDVTQTLTVEASAAPLLQTDNSEVSTVMERKLMIDLPLDLGSPTSDGSGRRQVETFIFLTPGITGNQWSKHFLGSPAHTSQAIIDGVPHALQESPGLTSRTAPPYEAVEEFKVSTTMYPAEQGRGFGIANYTLKSGTNEFHGAGFWFLRNDKLEASGFFNPTRPVVRQNEFGGTIGGPIVKNKTFFFGSFQGFRRRGGAAERGLQTIPTLDFREGDFSALREPDGDLIPIFDPSTTRPDGQGGFVRDPFPGNRIPAGRQSRVAQALFDQMPAPDGPGIVENWVNRSGGPADDDTWSVKIDHNEGPHRISGSWWWVNFDENSFSPWGDSILDNSFARTFTGGGIRVNWDWVATPTLLNHFGWGLSTSDKDRLANRPVDGNILNVPNIPQDVEEFPGFNFTGYLNLGSTGSGPDITRDDAIVFTDTVSWTKGKHQIKFGGEYWDQRFSRFDARQRAGVFDFNNLSTSQPNSPNVNRYGDSVASLLVGDVFSSNRLVNPTEAIYDTRYMAFFFEDKIQLTPKLTFTAGLRYDLPWPIDARDDIVSAIDPTLPNPAADGLPGAHVFGNDAVKPELDKDEWGPRLALAYSLNEKTVIRAGFGIIYAQSNALVSGMELGGNSLIAGFIDRSQPRSLDEGVTPAFELDNGPPPFEGTLPNFDPGIKVGDVADWINPGGGQAAYTTNYNFTIQRQFPWNIFTDIAYVGVKGTNLPAGLRNFNQTPSRFLSLGSTLQADINSPEAAAAGIAPPFPGFQGSVAQALRPFPQFIDVVTHADPIGNHTYHSLQLKLQRRFSDGLGFLVSYTLSKNISDTNGFAWANFANSALDDANRGLEKSISPLDVTQNLVTNWIYELPGKNLTGAKGKLLKGWQLGVTTTFRTGPPISIGGGVPLPIFGGGNRPSRVAGVERRTAVGKGDIDPAQDLFLDVGAFSAGTPFTFGDVGRTEPDIRGFSFWNENVTLLKRTYIPSISEQFNIEFRAQFFNLFNRTVFGNIQTNVNSPQNFGRVQGQVNEPRSVQFGLRVNF